VTGVTDKPDMESAGEEATEDALDGEDSSASPPTPPGTDSGLSHQTPSLAPLRGAQIKDCQTNRMSGARSRRAGVKPAEEREKPKMDISRERLHAEQLKDLDLGAILRGEIKAKLPYMVVDGLVQVESRKTPSDQEANGKEKRLLLAVPRTLQDAVLYAGHGALWPEENETIDRRTFLLARHGEECP